MESVISVPYFFVAFSFFLSQSFFPFFLQTVLQWLPFICFFVCFFIFSVLFYWKFPMYHIHKRISIILSCFYSKSSFFINSIPNPDYHVDYNFSRCRILLFNANLTAKVKWKMYQSNVVSKSRVSENNKFPFTNHWNSYWNLWHISVLLFLNLIELSTCTKHSHLLLWEMQKISICRIIIITKTRI